MSTFNGTSGGCTETPHAADDPRELYRAFCGKLLAEVRNLADAEGIAEYDDIRAVFTERGVEHQVVRKKEYDRLWYRHDLGLTKSQALAHECILSHIQHGILLVPDLSDSSGNRILTPPRTRRWLP